jgi:hypothetical protein
MEEQTTTAIVKLIETWMTLVGTGFFIVWFYTAIKKDNKNNE